MPSPQGGAVAQEERSFLFLVAPAQCPHDRRQAVHEVLEDCITIVCLGCPTAVRVPKPYHYASAPTSVGPCQAQPPPVAVTAAAHSAVAASNAYKPVVVPSDTLPGPGGPVYVTIRATADIPPFVDPDLKTHTLRAGDVATVPKSVATLLVRRGKAALVEVTA